MKTLFAALLSFTLAVSALAQTAGDNNPKSPSRHHTRPPYKGTAKHHAKSQPPKELTRAAGRSATHQPKPLSDHVVAH